MSELLPCPFCGGKVELALARNGGSNYIRHKCVSAKEFACPLEFTGWINGDETLVSDWNTRADIVSEREKRLRKAVRDLGKALDVAELWTMGGLPPAVTNIWYEHADTIKECE